MNRRLVVHAGRVETHAARALIASQNGTGNKLQVGCVLTHPTFIAHQCDTARLIPLAKGAAVTSAIHITGRVRLDASYPGVIAWTAAALATNSRAMSEDHQNHRHAMVPWHALARP